MMADSNYPGPDTIHRHQLPNGIVVLIYENHASESVVVEGLLRAGALVESREKAGLTQFTASALMRGTEKRDFEQIYEDLESVGASLGFSSGDHATGFSAHCLVEDLDLILDLMAQAVRRPSFPEGQIEKLRGQIMTSLHMRANDTRRMASLAFYELLYKKHPYGRSTQGYLETIANISRDDIVEFSSEYYGPRDMIITVVGGVAAKDALAQVTDFFGDWVRPEQRMMPAVPTAERPEEFIRTHVDMPQKGQSDIILGLPGPPRSAPDYLDASLMNTVLGVFGMMGRIGKSVREEQGLAYYAYSRLQGGLGPTPWYVSAGVAPDKVEQAINSVWREIGRIQDELVPEDELADSQAYRTGSMPVSLETNSGLASVITDIELFDLGLDYLQRYPDLINSITPERLQLAAQKYLSTKQVAAAVAGPKPDGEE
jgi:zinc protease